MSVSSISSSSSTNTTAAAASAAFRANRTFQSALVTLNENIDKFEHQTTWQLDNNTAVTLPAGVSNSSSASTTTATTNTSSPASTIKAGFSGLESNAESSLTDLTPDQQTQLDAENAKLTKEEQRFQGFAAHRGSVDAHQDNQYKGNTTLLGDQINAYEHQVTWQIDHGTAITPARCAEVNHRIVGNNERCRYIKQFDGFDRNGNLCQHLKRFNDINIDIWHDNPVVVRLDCRRLRRVGSQRKQAARASFSAIRNTISAVAAELGD